MSYTLTTIDGKMHLQAVNPHRLLKINAFSVFPVKDIEENNRLYNKFVAANPPILWIRPQLPEGTVLKDEEVKFVWQKLVGESWKEAREINFFVDDTRQVATLKESTKEERI